MVSASKKRRLQEEQNQQQTQLDHAHKRKMIKKIALVAIIAALVLAGGYAAWAKMTGPGKYDALAECMTAHGWTMYGTDWCQHCQRQKQMFGKSFRNIHFVNCDLSNACDEAGVEAYPTWGRNGQLEQAGVKEIDALARMTGCTLD